MAKSTIRMVITVGKEVTDKIVVVENTPPNKVNKDRCKQDKKLIKLGGKFKRKINEKGIWHQSQNKKE